MSRRSILKLFAAILTVGVFLAAGVSAYDRTGAGKMYHMFGDPYPRIITQAFAYVDRQYVEPKRAVPQKMLEGAFKGLETRFPPVRIDVDGEKSKVLVKVGDAQKQISTAAASDLDGTAKVVNEVLDFISPLLEGEEKKEDIYYAAINGAVSELDPHSSAINPSQFKEFMIGTRGSFGGIGFIFGIKKGEMSIISPIEGTPASRGGLRSGDRIVMINGEPTINMPVDVAASKMRGEPGTQVTLHIARKGWTEPKPFTFTREIINVDSVESYTLKGDKKPPALYVRVKNFQKDTAEELKNAIAEAVQKNPDIVGVVMDLRNNPGGLLDQAVELSDGFMDKGVIVSTRGRDGDSQSKSEAVNDEPFTSLPLVILINQGSASASEIVSGALRSYRALLIGNKTFGKGSVQKLFPLPDTGALKLTVAQYLTANDVSIQSIGIQPDIMTYGGVVEGKNIRIGPPPDHMGEADLKNPFTEWGNASESPWRELQYSIKERGDSLDDRPEEDDDEHPQRSFAELSKDEKLDKLKENFPIDLARRILGRVPEEMRKKAGREELKKYAAPVLEDVKVEENEKITQLLKKSGIDWKSGETSVQAPLAVKVKTPSEFKGGDTAEVDITVKNVGAKPVYRLWGRIDAKENLLNGKDFIFGFLDPGQEKSFKSEVKIPKSIISRWDPIKVELRSNGQKLDARGEGESLFRAPEKPEFAYTYSMSDRNPGKKELNANGVLDPGDEIDIILTVDNTGKGTGKTVEVNIRGDGEENIYLKSARQKLENFEPGQSRQAPMSFRFEKPDEEGNVKIVVSVSDADNNVFLSDELKFKAGKPYAADGKRAQPVIRLASLPPLRTANPKLKLAATAEDDGSVKEIYAYLGDKKVFYQKNQDKKKKLDAKFTVELKPGSNFLTIAATDDQEMISRKSFFVHLAEGGQELALGEKPKSDKATNVR